MFKYLLAIAVCLICLVVLQRGCQGFGERFRKRIEDRRERWEERWGNWHDRRKDETKPDDMNERRTIFRQYWQRRRERSDFEIDERENPLVEEM